MKLAYWILLGVCSAFSLLLEPKSIVYVILGFVGCIAIIFFAKTLGKLFLLKREDYYDVR